MLSKIEKAKIENHISRMDINIREREIKIMEREEDIARIQIEIEDYKASKDKLIKQLNGE